MLRDSVQHEIEIVFLARHALAQAGLGQRRNRRHQHIVRPFCLGDGFAPCGFSGLWNDREIVRAFGLAFLSGQPVARDSVPHRHVQHQFPDAVDFGQRLGRGRCGIHILQELKQGRAMPGIALKGACMTSMVFTPITGTSKRIS